MYMEALLQALGDCGLSPEITHLGFHAVDNHVLGYTLQEHGLNLGLASVDDPEALAADFVASMNPEIFPSTIAHVQQHLDGETGDSFEAVLAFILDGLARL
jgi:hypothetical protein